jgi:hypothetical protein
MLRRFKHLFGAVCLMAAVQCASAFSFYGPFEPFEIASLGYGTLDFSAPHNIGEEYRWNVPVLYYTYDQTFLDYFGSDGAAAGDAAFAILNNSLTNVSSWSETLDEIPLESKQLNYTAAALHLFDLKSFTLQSMVTELCLSDPVAFTWTLRTRVLPPGAACPDYEYTVIQRNFDPVTWDPSAYVNGVLYTYWIDELCPPPTSEDEAVTVPTSTDPLALAASPVARVSQIYSSFDYYGFYFTGLTRDDIGGLRYLLNTNNVILENAGSGTLTSITNSTSQLLYTSNLTALAQLALTNSDAQLATLYPGLVFSAPATNYPAIVTNSIVTTNYYTSPYGPLTNSVTNLVYTTNYTLSVQLDYIHFFGNLEAVVFTNGAWTTFPVTELNSFIHPQINALQTISISPTNTPDAPYGQPASLTNVSEKVFITNNVVGEFFIATSNYCNMLILANELTETNAETNLIYSVTNYVSYTNSSSSTNTSGSTNIEIYTKNLITYYTNHVFLALPVSCVGTNISLREGINTMQFVRRDYDSLLNRFWSPITNTFTAVTVTNNATYLETISRVVTAPDIVLSAADLQVPPTAFPVINTSVDSTQLAFQTNGIVGNPLGAVYGPGTVAMAAQGNPTIYLVFNKVGQLLYNFGPTTIDEATATPNFVWGSFDGTTNPPVVYPVGTSLTNFVGQIVLQTFPTALPVGSVGVPYAFAYANAASGLSYTNSFSGAGGQAPYTFSLATGSTLPPGLSLTASGALSGSPTAPGSFAFTIQMTDAGQRFIDTPYSITIEQ